MNGSVEVELEVERPTRCVVLHAAGMNITHAALLQPEHTHGAARGPHWPSSLLRHVCRLQWGVKGLWIL